MEQSPAKMKVSVVMPVYNEVKTIKEIVSRVNGLPLEKEIIIVDDNSNDGTRKEIKNLEHDYKNLKIIYHSCNKGKGAALKTGFKYITGDIVIIQDADLEYNPQEYPKLIRPIIEGKTQIVYGSRFLGNSKSAFLFWQYIGNKLLTFLCNIVNGLNLTDMATCYKVFSSQIIKDITIKSDGFGFCPEITAKIAKKRLSIYEIPIGYTCRKYSDGKKITWRDAFVHIFAIFWFRLFD